MKLASEKQFPYGHPGTVCYIEQTGDELVQCRYRDDLRTAVRNALAGESRIIAVWPGRYRSDLFLLDDLHALAGAVGVEPAP